MVFTSSAGAGVGLVVPDQWAFDGEEVTLDLKLTQETRASWNKVKSIMVDKRDVTTAEILTALTTTGMTKVKAVAKLPFVRVQLMDKDQKEIARTDTVHVIQLKLDALSKADKEESVSSVTAVMGKDGMIHRYAGVQFEGYHGGKARIYKDGGPISDIPFGDAIVNYMDMKDFLPVEFFGLVASYPVRVAVRDANQQEIVAGVTGAVMRSGDGGGSWKEIMITRNRSMKGVSGDHATCGRGSDGNQNILKGKAAALFDGDITGLNQICDIVLYKSTRIVVASDFGVQVTDDPETAVWAPIPGTGGSGEYPEGKVMNDLEVVGDKIFGASEAGVFVSTDGGMTWKKFDTGIKGPVFTIAFDARRNALFAGTNSGLYTSKTDAANWTSAGLSEPVVGVAVEMAAMGSSTQSETPASIMATTAKTGLMMSRDKDAALWAPVTQNGLKKVGPVSITSFGSGNLMQYGVMLGTADGVWFDIFTVNATTPEGATPPADGGNAGNDGSGNPGDNMPPADGGNNGTGGDAGNDGSGNAGAGDNTGTGGSDNAGAEKSLSASIATAIGLKL
jgi:hypothetical protein